MNEELIAELVAALGNYMSQFGQALEAHGISHSRFQQEAHDQATAAPTKAKAKQGAQ
jgi:hypothetical protein